MNLVRRISRTILTAERSLVVVLLAMMILLAFLQVVLRNIFGTGIIWADTLLRHLVLWVGFIGASIATQSEKQIAIDVLSRFVPERFGHLLRVVTYLFTAAVCILLAIAAYRFVLDERDAQTVLMTIGRTDIFTWQAQTVIPFGFALMAFRFLIQILEHISGFVTTNKARSVTSADRKR